MKVNVLRTTAQVAYQRVTQEIKAGAIQCDVFSSTDIGHYVELKAKGVLEKYVPDNSSKVLDIYKNYDPDGYYYVTSAGLIVIGYNTGKVKEADAPKNWTDLLDPKWKDQIALGHPGFSGYVGTWALTLRKQYGWDFFEKLAKNNPRVGRSINDTVTMLNAGECMIAGSGPVGTLLESAKKGNPLAMIYPSDGTVLIIAPSEHHEGRQASQRGAALHGVPDERRGLENLGRAFQRNHAARGLGPKGVTSAKDLKTIRPTVEEITKGIPEVIKQWREYVRRLSRKERDSVTVSADARISARASAVRVKRSRCQHAALARADRRARLPGPQSAVAADHLQLPGGGYRPA